MADPGHGLSGVGVSWVGLLRVCNSHGGFASGQAWPAVVLSQGATDMVIRFALLVLLSAIAGSLCARNARGERPCTWRMPRNGAAPVDCAAAQAPLVSCGGAPAASCMALGRAAANAFSVRPFHRVCPNGKCNRSCPNGKVQLLHLVKVARVVSGEKPKRKGGPKS